MEKDISTIYIRTLTQQHKLMGIESPRHPLFSIMRFEDFPKIVNESNINYKGICFDSLP